MHAMLQAARAAKGQQGARLYEVLARLQLELAILHRSPRAAERAFHLFRLAGSPKDDDQAFDRALAADLVSLGPSAQDWLTGASRPARADASAASAAGSEGSAANRVRAELNRWVLAGPPPENHEHPISQLNFATLRPEERACFSDTLQFRKDSMPCLPYTWAPLTQRELAARRQATAASVELVPGTMPKPTGRRVGRRCTRIGCRPGATIRLLAEGLRLRGVYRFDLSTPGGEGRCELGFTRWQRAAHCEGALQQLDVSRRIASSTELLLRLTGEPHSATLRVSSSGYRIATLPMKIKWGNFEPNGPGCGDGCSVGVAVPSKQGGTTP
jgi:hypothetical protein